MVTLLLASRGDVASVNLHDAVLRLGGWGEAVEMEHGTVRTHSQRPAHLLLIDQLHIKADGIDAIHEEETGQTVDEVLVLSRHVSASQTPAPPSDPVPVQPPATTPAPDEDWDDVWGVPAPAPAPPPGPSVSGLSRPPSGFGGGAQTGLSRPPTAMPDPHGAVEQPVMPWRGRITTSIAPGRADTTDSTEAAVDEVATFFGQADGDDFTADGQKITYHGPAEWSYRRFILHYAHLCAAAGGIDEFLIGSEMIGMTQIRGPQNIFP